MDVAQAEADVGLCCPALPINSRWHIQMCESQKPALLCPAWAALQNCVRNTAWRRQKQKQNCAALPSLSTRADIMKRVNHRHLRCSALCGLRCKAVSGTLRGAGKSRSRTVLPCPPSQLALTYSNVWITETCAALPCVGCVAKLCPKHCVAQAKADAELCCPAIPLNSRWHIETCESQTPALLCPAWAALQSCVRNTAWRRQKQKQNCAALPTLSTRADIFKRVNHRNLRCSALRGLRCLRLNVRPA